MATMQQDTTQENHTANSTPEQRDAQTTTVGAPSQQPTGSDDQGQDQGQAQSLNTDVSQQLQQQIAQAIHPVLDDFRRQLAQTVEQQAQSAPSALAQPIADGAQTTATQQLPATPSASQSNDQRQGPVQEAQKAPEPALKTVERQSEEWLSSLLVSGLTVLLTETTRVAVQHSAERGLHALLQKLFDATPDGTTNQEIQVKIERTLQAILRETLEAVFAEHTRTALQQDGQEAIQRSFHGDFGSAVKHIEHILNVLGEALLTVLRREWSTVVRLAAAVLLLSIEGSLAHTQNQQEHEQQAQSA